MPAPVPTSVTVTPVPRRSRGHPCPSGGRLLAAITDRGVPPGWTRPAPTAPPLRTPGPPRRGGRAGGGGPPPRPPPPSAHAASSAAAAPAVGGDLVVDDGEGALQVAQLRDDGRALLEEEREPLVLGVRPGLDQGEVAAD